MSTTKVALISTAGRGGDGHRMTKFLFDKMVDRAQILIRQELGSSAVHLISGGAAWADHIAVVLFIEEDKSELTLHLPCVLDRKKGWFVDNDVRNWQTNPGRSANKYH